MVRTRPHIDTNVTNVYGWRQNINSINNASMSYYQPYINRNVPACGAIIWRRPGAGLLINALLQYWRTIGS